MKNSHAWDKIGITYILNRNTKKMPKQIVYGNFIALKLVSI